VRCCVRYRTPEGRERNTSFLKRRVAEHYLTEIERSKLVGNYVDRSRYIHRLLSDHGPGAAARGVAYRVLPRGSAPTYSFEILSSPCGSARGVTRWREGAAGELDVLVVGGGAIGSGIVLEATLRGYRCALIECADFACCTSSRSSKLIHGCMRYRSGTSALCRNSWTSAHSC
jgi:hypothetical protein